jgi:phenylalanyl-tRNA synthetase beta chain
MKISYNWLQKFIKNGPKNPEEIGEKLTLHTAELEEIIDVANNFNQIFLGNLTKIQPHPEADNLFIGIFDLGHHGIKQIIYKNIYTLIENTCYPIALAGAQLKSGLIIKNSEIKNQKSEGMVCDNEDLGLTLNGLLSFPSSKKGLEFTKLDINLRDYLFDIDNKSLTHRPDLMGIRGFSREISAIFKKDLIHPEPVIMLPSTKNKVEVEVKSPNCRRFCALKLANITNQNLSLSERLMLSNLGIKSISGTVDITNLIMLEFGQPMHVFDADKISGKLIIRQAKKGEKLIALDDEEYELDETITVVADEEKVLSIAGIMGGRDSGVSSETKNIIFECANWDPTAVRKAAQKLGLRSESSGRYEKSLDPENCKKALFSAVEKCLEIENLAKITTQLTDCYPQVQKILTLNLSPKKLRKRAGIDISDQEIIKKLELIGFEVKAENKILEVLVPTYRATKDIQIEEDLIEEVVRLYGFANIEAKLPNLPINPPKRNRQRELEWQIKDFIASQGFLEVYNYDFVSKSDENFTKLTDYTEIANPLSSEYQFLRQTLISNLTRNLESEIKKHKEINLFEFGKVYLPSYEVLPKETLNFAGIKAKLSGNETNTFYELKQILDVLFSTLKIANQVEFLPILTENLPNYVHPTKSAKILINGKNIGIIATLHPQFLPVKNSHLVFFEINIEDLFSIIQDTKIVYQPISSYPSIYRDLSIVLDYKILISEIEKLAKFQAPNLKNIELFDEYQDSEKLGKNLKNLAFHLEFQSMTGTLEEGVIEAEFTAIVQVLNSELSAQLRLNFDQTKNN